MENQLSENLAELDKPQIDNNTESNPDGQTGDETGDSNNNNNNTGEITDSVPVPEEDDENADNVDYHEDDDEYTECKQYEAFAYKNVHKLANLIQSEVLKAKPENILDFIVEKILSEERLFKVRMQIDV